MTSLTTKTLWDYIRQISEFIDESDPAINIVAGMLLRESLNNIDPVMMAIDKTKKIIDSLDVHQDDKALVYIINNLDHLVQDEFKDNLSKPTKIFSYTQIREQRNAIKSYKRDHKAEQKLKQSQNSIFNSNSACSSIITKVKPGLNKKELFENSESLNSNTKSNHSTPHKDTYDAARSIIKSYNSIPNDNEESLKIIGENNGQLGRVIISSDQLINETSANKDQSKSEGSSSNLGLIKISCWFCKLGTGDKQLIKSNKCAHYFHKDWMRETVVSKININSMRIKCPSSDCNYEHPKSIMSSCLSSEDDKLHLEFVYFVKTFEKNNKSSSLCWCEDCHFAFVIPKQNEQVCIKCSENVILIKPLLEQHWKLEKRKKSDQFENSTVSVIEDWIKDSFRKCKIWKTYNKKIQGYPLSFCKCLN